MKLVSFEVPTAAGPVRRIGALSQDMIIDLNMGYVCYLKEVKGGSRAYEVAAAVLPADMIAYFRSGSEGKEAAKITIEYMNHALRKGAVAGP